jgi:hypothetical protein
LRKPAGKATCIVDDEVEATARHYTEEGELWAVVVPVGCKSRAGRKGVAVKKCKE